MGWQKAFRLCLKVYRESGSLPPHERFGLATELRKTARSIVYNVAEGQRRATRREFARFLDIALGSAAELETQLLLVEALRYFDKPVAEALLADVDEVSRLLYALKAAVFPSDN